MATTTTNFGWDIPQSTDLVKDGATAIAALGQDIDTSMMDLKGGTTGQILSKTSGTDMDFTWITPNPGDITGVTAGTGITGGGTSGDVTVSFDVANYGGGQYAAGKNKIINGDFGIWQRGTSFSTLGNFCADRFKFNADGGSMTVTQQTFTAGTAPVSGYEGTYYLQMATTVSGSLNLYILQTVEDVRTFANQTITLSYWAKTATGTVTSTPLFAQNFGSGGSAEVVTNASNSATITTSWTRFSHTITLPSIAGKTIGTSSYLNVQVLRFAASATVSLWGVQLEAGSTATPFQTATGTKQGELAACQRYYVRFANTSNANATVVPSGITYSATTFPAVAVVPTTLRTNPTSIEYANLQIIDSTFTQYTITNVAISQNGNPFIICDFTASGMTAGRSGWVRQSSTSGYLAFNAEL